MLVAILLSALALVLSYVGVATLRRWAEQRQLFDIPTERSSHTRPTVRGAGLIIVVITLAGAWLFSLSARTDVSWHAFLLATLGALIIAGVSWVDDHQPLSPGIRLLVQSIAAALALWGLGYWHTATIPVIKEWHIVWEIRYIGWVGIPITFLWIVGLTNAYNFMDGIDGIAGSQAVIAGIGWFMLGWVHHQALVSAIGLLLAASSLGFLGHNWPPARIFMGDVGSAFLGYTLAILPLLFNKGDSWYGARLAGALLVWPFVFDTALTFLRRLRDGENVFKPHRSHFYQRLVIAGYSHQSVTLLYIVLSLIGLFLALIWSLQFRFNVLAVISVVPMLCLALWVFVRRRERLYAARLHQQARQTLMLSD